MATVTGVTAQRADEIEAASVVGATIQGKNLVLTTHGGTQINVGQIIPDLYTNYPVGSIYMTSNPANPSTYMGGGTWARWGQGRVPVSINEADPAFDGIEETGGSKTHTLQLTEIPSHDHGGITGYQDTDHAHNGYTTSTGGHEHNYEANTNRQIYAGTGTTGATYTGWTATTSGGGAHNHDITTYGASANHRHSITAQGGGAAHNIMQPYITCYMWKRTA